MANRWKKNTNHVWLLGRAVRRLVWLVTSLQSRLPHACVHDRLQDRLGRSAKRRREPPERQTVPAGCYYPAKGVHIWYVLYIKVYAQNTAPFDQRIYCPTSTYLCITYQIRFLGALFMYSNLRIYTSMYITNGTSLMCVKVHIL